MSAAASRWAWAVRGVTPTQKLVLVCLADHAGKDGGNCFPSIRRIVEECCLSERTVRYALRQLETGGYVVSDMRSGKSTTYSLPVEGGQEMPPARDAPRQEMPGRGATGAGEGGNTCPHNHKEPSPNRKKKSAPKTEPFVKPTVDEVRAYCQERGNSINPEGFVAYYESNGWKVGKNPMKSWKGSVITWEQRNNEAGQQGVGRSGRPETIDDKLRRLRGDGKPSVGEPDGGVRGQVLEGIWGRA